MARSFFTGTDERLLTGSANFSTRLSAEWAALGVAESLAVEYAALNAAYAASYQLAYAPSTRTTTSVIGRNSAEVPLRRMASKLAKIIDAAGLADDPMKSSLGLNVPAKRSPMAAPGAPTSFRVALLALGWIELRWTCDNPVGAHGTLYQLWRRIGDGPYEHVGSSGKKKFLDATIPAGSASVTYKVQAIRSTVTGPAAEFNVCFGVSAGAATPALQPKMAA